MKRKTRRATLEYIFFRCQDNHNQAWFKILSEVPWLGFLLDMLCFLLVPLVLFEQHIMHTELGEVPL